MSLKAALNDESQKSQIVADTVALINDEVSDKSGLSGMALKAGYKTIKGVKPGFVENVVDGLLPEFADALDPIHEEAKSAGTPVGQHFSTQKSRVADALLAITDAKAEGSTNRVVKGTYSKLRGTAKKHVEAAVPRLASLISKYS